MLGTSKCTLKRHLSVTKSLEYLQQAYIVTIFTDCEQTWAVYDAHKGGESLLIRAVRAGSLQTRWWHKYRTLQRLCCTRTHTTDVRPSAMQQCMRVMRLHRLHGTIRPNIASLPLELNDLQPPGSCSNATSRVKVQAYCSWQWLLAECKVVVTEAGSLAAIWLHCICWQSSADSTGALSGLQATQNAARQQRHVLCL